GDICIYTATAAHTKIEDRELRRASFCVHDIFGESHGARGLARLPTFWSLPKQRSSFAKLFNAVETDRRTRKRCTRLRCVRGHCRMILRQVRRTSLGGSSTF